MAAAQRAGINNVGMITDLHGPERQCRVDLEEAEGGEALAHALLIEPRLLVSAAPRACRRSSSRVGERASPALAHRGAVCASTARWVDLRRDHPPRWCGWVEQPRDIAPAAQGSCLSPSPRTWRPQARRKRPRPPPTSRCVPSVKRPGAVLRAQARLKSRVAGEGRTGANSSAHSTRQPRRPGRRGRAGGAEDGKTDGDSATAEGERYFGCPGPGAPELQRRGHDSESERMRGNLVALPGPLGEGLWCVIEAQWE